MSLSLNPTLKKHKVTVVGSGNWYVPPKVSQRDMT